MSYILLLAATPLMLLGMGQDPYSHYTIEGNGDPDGK